MTIDEAIKDIKDNIKPVVGGISLDMAIDALEFRERYDYFWEEVKSAGMKGKETEILQNQGGGAMNRYYVEGTFEGYIEADSADEAEENFHETDIQDITVLTVYKDED